jgi:fucose permease
LLHPAFALTGIVHAIGGPLLPSLAAAFHLGDSQSGFLFMCYFAGTSLGALLVYRNYARTMTIGFMALTIACLTVAVTNSFLLQPLFFVLGICVGVPMSAVSIYVGRLFAERSAAPLTFLNFSWSGGALLAPLIAARLLVSHSYRSAYCLLSVAAAAAAVACWFLLKDPPDNPPAVNRSGGLPNLRFIAFFAFLAFLEVGIENTAASWFATYALRSSGSGASAAAASSSLYWVGFLASRGLSSLLLLRIHPMRVLRVAVVVAAVASGMLIGLPGIAGRSVAMFILGAALAPIFPLLLARFFAGARNTSDSRFILAICGFGGSVVPAVTGFISARSGSLRLGLMTVPVALLLMICLMPLMAGKRGSSPISA